MSMYSDDCVCVQGIEQFIDPRLTLPAEDGLGDIADVPIWQQDAYNEYLKSQDEQEKLKGSKNAIINPERVLNLYVQGLSLINKDFVDLVAYQRRSFYVRLESLDESWLNKPVSLVFQHIDTGEQAIVPILEMGKLYYIPESVLVPGSLHVTALAITKSSQYASMATKAIKLTVKNPEILPVDWQDIPPYDAYYTFYSSIRNLAKAIDVRLREHKLVASVSASVVHGDSETTTIVDTPFTFYEANGITHVSILSTQLKSLKLGTEYKVKVTIPTQSTTGETFIAGTADPVAVVATYTFTDHEHDTIINEVDQHIYVAKGESPEFILHTPTTKEDDITLVDVTLIFYPFCYYRES